MCFDYSLVLGYSMGERRKLVIGVQSLHTFYLKSTETFSARMDSTMPKVLVVLTFLLY